MRDIADYFPQSDLNGSDHRMMSPGCRPMLLARLGKGRVGRVMRRLKLRSLQPERRTTVGGTFALLGS
jgi:hypothetical protein